MANFSTTDYKTSNTKANGSIPKNKVISFKVGCDLTESESQPGKSADVVLAVSIERCKSIPANSS